MIKTQIQMSEELHEDLKRLARRKEWSLAETLRRAGETFLQQYADPDVDLKATLDTAPPSSAGLARPERRTTQRGGHGRSGGSPLIRQTETATVRYAFHRHQHPALRL